MTMMGNHPTRHVLLQEDDGSSDEEHADDEKCHDRVDGNSDLCVAASRQTPYPAGDPSVFQSRVVWARHSKDGVAHHSKTKPNQTKPNQS